MNAIVDEYDVPIFETMRIEEKRQRVLDAFYRTPGLLSIGDEQEYAITQTRSSGIKVNLKESWDNPLLLNDTALLMHQSLGLDTIHTVVGIESGGSPLATLLSARLPAKLRLIRKEESDIKDVLAGSGNPYIGNVLVVDDVLGRGDSLIRTLGRITGVADSATFLSVFSYGSEERLQSELGIAIKSLFQVSDLIGIIEDDEKRKAASKALRLYQTQIGNINE